MAGTLPQREPQSQDERQRAASSGATSLTAAHAKGREFLYCGMYDTTHAAEEDFLLRGLRNGDADRGKRMALCEIFPFSRCALFSTR